MGGDGREFAPISKTNACADHSDSECDEHATFERNENAFEKNEGEFGEILELYVQKNIGLLEGAFACVRAHTLALLHSPAFPGERTSFKANGFAFSLHLHRF